MGHHEDGARRRDQNELRAEEAAAGTRPGDDLDRGKGTPSDGAPSSGAAYLEKPAASGTETADSKNARRPGEDGSGAEGQGAEGRGADGLSDSAQNAAGNRVGAGAPASGTGPDGGTAAPSSFRERLRHLFRPGTQAEQRSWGSAEATETSEPVPQRVQFQPVRTGFGLAVGVALLVALWLVLASLSQLLLWIGIALFIALGLDPIVRFVERRGFARPVGVISVAVLALAVAGAFLGTLIPALITQITQLVEATPGIIHSVTTNPMVQDWDKQFHLVDQANEQLNKFMKDPKAVGGLYSGVIGAGNLVGQFAFGALIVMVLAIYILASLPGLKRFLYSLVPASKRARTAELSEQITRSVGNYVIGQVTVATVNALVAFIIMMILHVPYPALLALVVAVLAFIPLVGGVIAGTLVGLITLISLGWQAALIYVICYFAYLQVEAYFVSPKIMARAVKVPGAVAVIAVIAGGTLLGVAGALMAIPVAASLLLLVREVWVRRQDHR